MTKMNAHAKLVNYSQLGVVSNILQNRMRKPVWENTA